MNDFLWHAVLCDILLPFLAERVVMIYGIQNPQPLHYTVSMRQNSFQNTAHATKPHISGKRPYSFCHAYQKYAGSGWVG